VENVYFELRISVATKDPPPGYLFLCPGLDFQPGPSSFCQPDCPAYWSLDPSGVERLTPEEAVDCGFPSLRFQTTVLGTFWAGSVYAGLRQFHRAKGFDPDSQDIALHLEEPLFILSSEMDPPFAHGKSTILTDYVLADQF
jgi:hypothetical protein